MATRVAKFMLTDWPKVIVMTCPATVQDAALIVS
jgi:hypothetical protein